MLKKEKFASIFIPSVIEQWGIILPKFEIKDKMDSFIITSGCIKVKVVKIELTDPSVINRAATRLVAGWQQKVVEDLGEMSQADVITAMLDNISND